ncbi:MAG: S8 family serine peptidase, partial [candidate division Zixibacteria bacterium]|nr:S8 family serine peptidase [candidate division Zixibacteria bacterium]
MKKKRILSCLILILLGLSSFSTAGTLSSNLSATLKTAANGERIPVLVILPDRKDAISLKEKLVSSYATRAERHNHGMRYLQRRADDDQKGILQELHRMETAGLAAKIKSHWLINAVTAEIAASELEKLASRKDLLEVGLVPKAVGIAPPKQSDESPDLTKLAGEIEWNIKAIGADSAWRLGYTGAGRLVCSFDTGVKGIHPALINGWKGHDGDSAAAWFDPIYGESFPHYIANAGSYPWHGTHTTGTMVGIDNVTGDTIGVAPEAKWIAAGVIDVPGASIIDAFEWAADPDGDPNTISDVPDVINHSWGITNEEFGCNDYFWAMIDNSEALGIVNIFAAGNDGVAGSISNPANRPECFAVGALDSITTTDTLIANFSSLGPSDCDGTTTKPDVVAPGVAIRSSYTTIPYYSAGGTSMASPHVSGAVALLRQAAPDATVDEIKQALKDGCIPLGESSPNDTMGYGLIYIPAAIEALAPAATSDLRVAGFNHGNPDPGASASIPVYITNKGGQLTDVYGIISGGTGKVTYSADADSLYFGTV